MSNLWINIRFFCFHFQWEYGKFYPIITYNEYHINIKYREGYFRVYDFRSPFDKNLMCALFGHKVVHNAVVMVKPHYDGSLSAPQPNHGCADICSRCHEILTEIDWEFKEENKESEL